jgi:hypothetical protein
MKSNELPNKRNKLPNKLRIVIIIKNSYKNWSLKTKNCLRDTTNFNIMLRQSKKHNKYSK